jgi:Uma2 family endonuclease
MKAGQLVSVEEYLRSDFQPDCEYVKGEIQERNLGELDHSGMQGTLVARLWPLRNQGLYTWPEQRVQVKPTRFRVPDLTVTIGRPQEQILTAPPYIVIEVLSVDDTLVRIMERVCDYEEFGVTNILIIDPGSRRAYVALKGALQPVEALCTGAPEVTLDLGNLFE